MAEKVLVTGVAGFIGSHVARKLMEDGISVVGVDDLSSGKRPNIPAGVDFIQGDLSDPGVMNELPAGVKQILHLAGQSSGEISFDDPVLDLKKNVVSTLNLIAWGIRCGCKRFIYASSMSVYGHHDDSPAQETDPCAPLSCYGTGKLAAEHYLRVYSKQLPFVSLRMFNVYGPGQDMENMRQGMVSIFLKMAATRGIIHVRGSLERYRDFICIDDVAEIWRRAVQLDENQSYVLNVGTGIKTTVQDLLNHIRLLLPGIKVFTEGMTPGDQHGIYADTTELQKVLGITSFTFLDTGLKTFAAWALNST